MRISTVARESIASSESASRSATAALLLLIAAALAWLAASGQASAMTKQEKLCRDGTADQQVEACTELIGKTTKTLLLSVYYNNRAFGWWNKNECHLAIADFGDAANIAKRGGYELDQYNYILRRGRVWADCTEDLKQAIVTFSEAIALHDSYEQAYFGRGNAYSGLGESDKAISDFNEALRRAPKYANVYLNRGNEWKTKGDLDRALSDLSDAIRLAPKESKPYANRGELWLLRGELDKALADQNKAIQLGKDQFAVLYLMRGDTYRYRLEFDKALADYNKASSLYENYAGALVGLGLTYEKMGDAARAKESFAKALTAAEKFNTAIEPTRTAYDTAKAHLAAYEAQATAATAAAPAPATPPDVAIAAAAPPAATPVAHPALERRIALVVGNSAYRNVAALPNPSRDANAVAAGLKQIGFTEVTTLIDADHNQLADALRKFAGDAEGADWAMVYYAGHGIEVGGTNFLVPVDARLAVDRDTQYEAVPLDQVLTAVEGARKLRLVLLDSCRDNPFAMAMRRTSATRSISRGFDRIEPATGMLVVYAARDGQVALDGDGASSPFTTAFLRRLPAPGIEITKLFRLVRDDVVEATTGRQEPYVYGSLPGSADYFFVAGK